MRFFIEDDEVPILAARLGLPEGVIKEQVEDALIEHVTGVRSDPRRREALRHSTDVVAGPRRTADCEQAIAAAIADDKMTAARADHWRRRWERDPVRTAALLARLAPVPGLNKRSAPVAAGPSYPPEWLAYPERPQRQPTGRRRNRVMTDE